MTVCRSSLGGLNPYDDIKTLSGSLFGKQKETKYSSHIGNKMWSHKGHKGPSFRPRAHRMSQRGYLDRR